MSIDRILVYGSDPRTDYIAERMYNLGFEIIRQPQDDMNDIALVLPPPVTMQIIRDIGVFLNKSQIIFGGAISEEVAAYLSSKQICYYDYLKQVNIIRENAKLTAEGIIKEAVSDGAVLEESNCLVLGYGFCGKEIAEKLKSLNANVDVMVRKKELEKNITQKGYNYVNFDIKNYSKLYKYSYVFNTVPALVINRKFIDNLSSDAMIFDIASKPGGTDFNYCREKGITAYHCLGIPGKMFKKEAGYLIAEAVTYMLK